MQITIRGELTMAQLRQVIYEKLLELEDDYALAYSQGATLYVNPSDGRGSPVELKAKDGRKLTKIFSEGPYRSAAEDYKI
jgi:hypothetical protein